ncbi:hypothetical protein OIO90_004590 [Microbotryomycetes sp. JL221]|nr:hypothetical protein OIO90_004590 [Microbotryomycetes sp. JL221]
MPLPLDAVAASFITSSTRRDAPLDDWETGCDDEFDDQQRVNATSVTDNAKLWSEANKPKLAYTIVSNASSSASSSASRSVPPVQALSKGPALTILKRPSSTTSTGSNTSSNGVANQSSNRKTLVQRKEEYEEAKRKIYGNEDATSSAHSSAEVITSKVAKIKLGNRDQRTSSSSSTGSKDRLTATRTTSGRGTPRQGSPVLSESGDSSNNSGNTKQSKTPQGVVRAPRGAGEGKGFGRKT